MTIGSLFAGIGGFDLGFRQAGHESRWCVEIDDACRRILARHFPEASLHTDVRKVGRHNLEPVDVVCGGFPCQDASVMQGRHGERAGVNGARTGLVWESLRICDELRPTWVVLENVRGFLSVNHGEALRTVLKALDDLGYVGQWRLVDGAAFHLPLRREHLLIVGFNQRDHGDLPEGFGLSDPEGRDEAGPQLLEGAGQPWPADGRPALGRHYRLLTPEECEIGLGFPEGWTAGQPRTTRYKQLGNTVAVPAVEWVCGRMAPPPGWQPVVFAADLPLCDCCGEEAWCPVQDDHYADCPCIGPTEDDVEYIERDGVLFGRRLANEDVPAPFS